MPKFWRISLVKIKLWRGVHSCVCSRLNYVLAHIFLFFSYMSNTVESTLFVRMEWIRNLIRIPDSTAFVSMLTYNIHS